MSVVHSCQWVGISIAGSARIDCRWQGVAARGLPKMYNGLKFVFSLWVTKGQKVGLVGPFTAVLEGASI